MGIVEFGKLALLPFSCKLVDADFYHYTKFSPSGSSPLWLRSTGSCPPALTDALPAALLELALNSNIKAIHGWVLVASHMELQPRLSEDYRV